jgi:hypothetical protein
MARRLVVLVDVTVVKELVVCAVVGCNGGSMRLTDISFEAQGSPCEFLLHSRVVAECHGDRQFLVLDVCFCFPMTYVLKRSMHRASTLCWWITTQIHSFLANWARLPTALSTVTPGQSRVTAMICLRCCLWSQATEFLYLNSCIR